MTMDISERPEGYQPVDVPHATGGPIPVAVGVAPFTISALPSAVLAPHVAQQQGRVANVTLFNVPITASSVVNTSVISQNAKDGQTITTPAQTKQSLWLSQAWGG